MAIRNVSAVVRMPYYWLRVIQKTITIAYFFSMFNTEMKTNKQLENAFNQIHAFKILNQEAQQETIEEELEVAEKHMSDDERFQAKRAMNVGQ
jgi:signal-transduction protein with cAMP-binding, CBS, and nucleotidyltransferase domain